MKSTKAIAWKRKTAQKPIGEEMIEKSNGLSVYRTGWEHERAVKLEDG